MEEVELTNLRVIGCTGCEMREINHSGIQTHLESCSAARTVQAAQSKPDEKNSLKLAIGKFLGFEAQGKVGMVLSAIFWAIVGAVVFGIIMHAKEVSSLVQGVSQ